MAKKHIVIDNTNAELYNKVKGYIMQKNPYFKKWNDNVFMNIILSSFLTFEKHIKNNRGGVKNGRKSRNDN